MGLILTSPVFEPNDPIPKRYTADGDDLSPPLHIGGIPSDTAELALIVDDPDAPTASPWVHWVACRIAQNMQACPRASNRMSGQRGCPTSSKD